MKHQDSATRRYAVEETWASAYGPFYVRDTEVPYGNRESVVQTFTTADEAQARADELNAAG